VGLLLPSTYLYIILLFYILLLRVSQVYYSIYIYYYYIIIIILLLLVLLVLLWEGGADITLGFETRGRSREGSTIVPLLESENKINKKKADGRGGALHPATHITWHWAGDVSGDVAVAKARRWYGGVEVAVTTGRWWWSGRERWRCRVAVLGSEGGGGGAAAAAAAALGFEVVVVVPSCLDLKREVV
jgi:hypothetical protein